MNDYIISTRHIKKNYGKKTAIDDFNIDISSNIITGLIGKNGSGKTTLLRILAGQLDFDGGEVEVFGENPMDNLKVLQDLIYIYHNYKYTNGLSLNTILSIYNELFSNFDIDFALKLIKYFNLRQSMKYQQLSQGMASIFNFICGIACRAKLTMLDEPVLGMDVSVRKSVYEILLRDYNEHPRNFIISSHLISEIEGVLSDIILIDEGKLVLYDSIDIIRESAYRIDGPKINLDQITQGSDVIYEKNGNINSYAVIRGTLTDDLINVIKSMNLEVSQVRVEDLFVYITKHNKEDELECLWETKK